MFGQQQREIGRRKGEVTIGGLGGLLSRISEERKRNAGDSTDPLVFG